MKVLQIGNFGPEFSTENDLRRTLIAMGHEVDKLQENEQSVTHNKNLVKQRASAADMVLWTHTHSFDVGNMLDGLRESGTPTAAIHLDLYRNLDREHIVRSHPFFRCDYVFTPDNSDPQFWVDNNVNHYWSPPGILESSCYLAEPVRGLISDIIFVGARGYHGEYKFRGQLLTWLQRTYKQRFKLYEHSSGMRGHKLNQLYASARVVIGDSCFAGKMPTYWSDRLPETLGRGGRLIFPRIEGLPDDLPCRTFQPGDLTDLTRQIRGALIVKGQAELEERERYIEWTLAGHTYRHRLQNVIDTVFGEREAA